MSESPLDDIVQANRAGRGTGIVSVCSAHPLVLRAALKRGRDDGAPVLIEATCNQVNQEGGYTGMVPAEFRARVMDAAREVGFAPERLVLGGDHLGPNPWRGEPARSAMEKAATMVCAYVAAGFDKLHLDASMACADDDAPLDDARIAERAVRLCRAAEDASDERERRDGASPRPRYVIGTEVPVPGGAHGSMEALEVTDVDALRVTLETHREAFERAGLKGAWQRVVGVVVQPGVEFGHADIVDYDRDRARALVAYASEMPAGMAFEAHSTDYQGEEALRSLVEDHFPILKVGPGLTFALREALFALDMMDAERVPEPERAGLINALERAMLDAPAHWEGYYRGDDAEQAFARRYSLSDRSRYYWTMASVEAARRRLAENFVRRPPPVTLMSQYLPDACEAVRDGRLPPLRAKGDAQKARDGATGRGSLTADDVVEFRVERVLRGYARACDERPRSTER